MASTCNVIKGSVGALSLIQTTGGVSFGGAISRLIVPVFIVTALFSLNNGVNGVIKANNLASQQIYLSTLDQVRL